MIAIITVNYNNAKITNKMLANIAELNRNDIKVVVVDNNSEDRDELDKTEFSTNLYLDSNIGYFPALNKGLKNIDLDLFEYVIICNNDLIFENNFFSILRQKKYVDSVYSVSPRIFDMDGIDQNPVFDRSPSKFKLFFYSLYYKNYYFGQILYNLWQLIKPKPVLQSNDSHPIFQGYGAIYILTKNFFKKNKSLDTPPFLMEEEAFLGAQIYKTDGILYYDSELIVHHQEHSSCKKIPSKVLYNYSKQSFQFSKKLMCGQKIVSDEMHFAKYEIE